LENKQKGNITVNKICEKCNTFFVVKDNKKGAVRRFCSQTCSAINNQSKSFRYPIVSKICLFCKKEFQVKQDKKHSKTVCCSEKCVFSLRNSSDRQKLSVITASLNKIHNIPFTSSEAEILDGILLGDGHLTKLKTSPIFGILTSSKLTYGCKFRETLEDVQNGFVDLTFNNINTSFKKDTKTYMYNLHSNKSKILYNERLRWYPEGKKIVPTDVRITPLSCYWWFIGDGSVGQNVVHLATHCFLYEEVQFLCNKLIQLNFKAGYYLYKEKYGALHISNGDDFISWLAEHNKISPQYLYKWNNLYNYCRTRKYPEKFTYNTLRLIERN
jgi:hypothetical protein